MMPEDREDEKLPFAFDERVARRFSRPGDEPAIDPLAPLIERLLEHEGAVDEARQFFGLP